MSPPPPRRITLLTDFGDRDGYVAAMKGVLATRAPEALLDDAGHGVPRGDVVAAMWALARYWDRFPPGTVHLAVVDPGVGTERRALACQADGRGLVAPDNGLLTRVLDAAASWRCVALDPARVEGAGPSTTFHGRDLFAPAAAHLARGEPLEALGEPVTDPVRLREPPPRRDGDGGWGEVVGRDRFGNLGTNLPGAWVTARCRVRVAGAEVPLVKTYGDVAPGALLAVVNSDGRVEVAVRDGSAAERLGVGPGETVRLVAERL